MKHLRLAKISTMEAANEYLEKEYWPEWNECFRAAREGLPRSASPPERGAGILPPFCAMPRIESSPTITHFLSPGGGIRFSVSKFQAGVRLKSCGGIAAEQGVKARYQGHYLAIGECSLRAALPQSVARKPPRRDHNAGGKSVWMQGFFDRPAPLLWKSIGCGA